MLMISFHGTADPIVAFDGGRKPSGPGIPLPKRSRPTYHPEFRHEMVARVLAGRSPESLSREFTPSAQAIRTRVRQAAQDAAPRRDGLTTPERTELARLRRKPRPGGR